MKTEKLSLKKKLCISKISKRKQTWVEKASESHKFVGLKSGIFRSDINRLSNVDQNFYFLLYQINYFIDLIFIDCLFEYI